VHVNESPDVSGLLKVGNEIGDQLGLDRFESGRTGISLGARITGDHVGRPLISLCEPSFS